MKKWFAAITALTMLCTLCACGGKETTPFHMKLEKGDDGYTCYGFAKPENAVGQVEIPADVNGTAVQYVGSSAFKDSDVGAVTISEGIEEIGEAVDHMFDLASEDYKFLEGNDVTVKELMAAPMYTAMGIAGSKMKETTLNCLIWVGLHYVLCVICLLGILPIMGI